MSLAWVLPVVLSIVGAVATVALFPILSNALQKHRPEGKGAEMITLGLGGLDPLFNPSNRHLTKQREHEAVMPELHPDGAPPRTKIDLEQGRATIHLPTKDTDKPTT